MWQDNLMLPNQLVTCQHEFLKLKNRSFHNAGNSHHSIQISQNIYNRTRQHSTLNYQSPIQYRNRWRITQNQENWLHNIHLMDDEISREPLFDFTHYTGRIILNLLDLHYKSTNS
jgi:hypothetical protein